KAAPLVWFDRLQRTSRELGYQSLGDPATAERDLSAISTLEAAFAELERLAGWQERKTDKLSTAEVLTLLETSLRETPIDLATNDEGRVRFVSVETARRLHPQRLFLVGMTEQSFPAPRPTSAVGHLQPSVDDHHSREMLQFYELVMSASEQVVFSYPTIDNAGQPLSPSSYVSEIERLLAPASIREARLPSPTPTTLAELRSRAVDDLHQGEGRYLKKALSLQAPGGESLAAGLRVSIARSTGDHFGVAEGMLAGRVAKQQLATRFNPEHLWSPTQLETYAACPFKFFLRQVLGIDEPAEFDLRVDYRRRGSLLHDAMVHLHSRLSEAGDALAEIAQIDNSEFVQAFRDAVSAAQASIPESPQQAALVEIEATQATRWGEGYQAQLQKFTDKDDTSGKMRPAYFETRFGPPRNGELLTPPSRPEPFELEIDGETILLTGQVDRIDLGEVDGELVFNVVDYKTAKSVTASGVELREGRQLQLFLYTLATEQHLLADQGARPWRLGYWAVREKGFQPPTEDRKTLLPTEVSEGRVVATEQWEEYGQAVRKRIAEIVRGVRQGDFPMLNPNEECGRNCEFRTTCRVTQTRRLGKTLPGEADADSEGDQQEAPT
ncbi:MAG: PD-(D/E)XK nuclease family protein, partial [Planctomycetota bacterium]